jgi:hypothetical protein
MNFPWNWDFSSTLSKLPKFGVGAFPLPRYATAADPMKKNEMGGACETYGRQERCIQGLDGKI